MDIGRTFALVSKEIKRVVREPANLFMVVIFPLVLTLAFGASFGAMGGGESRYTVGVVSYDTGTWGNALVGALNAVPALDVRVVDDAAAQTQLQQGQLKAVITIPADFSESVDSYRGNPSDPSTWHRTTLDLSVDKGSMTASAAVPPMVGQVLSALVTGGSTPGLPVTVGEPTMVDSQRVSQFAYMAPGLFGYAAIFLIMIVAQALTTEREQGILRRISVTPTTTGDIFASQIVSNALVGVAQFLVVFVASYAMGFRPLGGFAEIAVAFVAVELLVLCAVGLGLIVAAFARNSGAATGISFVFIIPLMFLGTFVPAPDFIAHMVPSWYLTDAITSVFIRGAPAASQAVLSDMMTLGAASVVIVLVGVLLFKRFGSS